MLMRSICSMQGFEGGGPFAVGLLAGSLVLMRSVPWVGAPDPLAMALGGCPRVVD